MHHTLAQGILFVNKKIISKHDLMKYFQLTDISYVKFDCITCKLDTNAHM